MRTSVHPMLATTSMVVLSATLTLLPAAARAETPLGVASLAEAKAICEQDLAACKRDASEDRPTSPRGRKLDQHRRLLLAAPLRMAGNAREGVSLDLLLEVVEHEFHIEVPLSGQGSSTQWSRSPNWYAIAHPERMTFKTLRFDRLTFPRCSGNKCSI